MTMTAKGFQAIAEALKDGREALTPAPFDEQLLRGAVTIQGQQAAYDAKARRDSNAENVRRVFDAMARSFASHLATANPKFNRARFLREAGVES